MWFPPDTHIYLVPVCRSALPSLTMVYLPEELPTHPPPPPPLPGEGSGAGGCNVRKHIIQAHKLRAEGAEMIAHGVSAMWR